MSSFFPFSFLIDCCASGIFLPQIAQLGTLPLKETKGIKTHHFSFQTKMALRAVTKYFLFIFVPRASHRIGAQ